MKKILYIISIISCATHSVYAQKDSVTWSKSLSLESRPYAPLSGNTLSKNIGANFSMFGQYKRSSLLILKGIDLVDEKSSANYLFVEYAYKKAYKRVKFRYSVLTSVNNPALVFDSKGSMSGASIGLSCGKYPRFELSGFYIVPWYYDPNYIIKPRLVWEKSNEESFSICSWYNSGMFGKKTGLSAGVEYSSKKIVLKNGMHAKISIVYNYDIAGNILHIENQSSKDVFSIRTFLNF